MRQSAACHKDCLGGRRERINTINDNTIGLDETEEDILTYEVSTSLVQ
jgi:hypothetical protein